MNALPNTITRPHEGKHEASIRILENVKTLCTSHICKVSDNYKKTEDSDIHKARHRSIIATAASLTVVAVR